MEKSKKTRHRQINADDYFELHEPSFFGNKIFTSTASELKALQLIDEVRKRIKSNKEIEPRTLKELVGCFERYDRLVLPILDNIDRLTDEAHEFLKEYDFSFSVKGKRKEKLDSIDGEYSLKEMLHKLYGIYLLSGNTIKFKDRGLVFHFFFSLINQYITYLGSDTKFIYNPTKEKNEFFSVYKRQIIAAYITHSLGFPFLDKRKKITKTNLKNASYDTFARRTDIKEVVKMLHNRIGLHSLFDIPTRK